MLPQHRGSLGENGGEEGLVGELLLLPILPNRALQISGARVILINFFSMKPRIRMLVANMGGKMVKITTYIGFLGI